MRPAILVAVAITVGGCTVATTGDSMPTGDCVVRGVTVAPAETTLQVGDTLRAVASVPACGGVVVTQFQWKSSNVTVAVVDSVSGLIHALKRGTASIVASEARQPNVQGAMALQVAP